MAAIRLMLSTAAAARRVASRLRSGRANGRTVSGTVGPTAYDEDQDDALRRIRLALTAPAQADSLTNAPLSAAVSGPVHGIPSFKWWLGAESGAPLISAENTAAVVSVPDAATCTVSARVDTTDGQTASASVTFPVRQRSLSVTVSSSGAPKEGEQRTYSAAIAAGGTGLIDPGPYTYDWSVDGVPLQSGASATFNHTPAIPDAYHFTARDQQVSCAVTGVVANASDALTEAMQPGDATALFIAADQYNQNPHKAGAIIDRAGGWRFLPGVSNPTGLRIAHTAAWHRALKRWVLLRNQAEGYDSATEGVYISDGQMVPGAAPGSGWTKILTADTYPNSNIVSSMRYAKPVCQLHDGGVMFLTTDDYYGQTPKLIIVTAAGSASVVAASGLPHGSSILSYKLFSVRGSQRCFIMGVGLDGYSRTMRYADPPYTDWYSSTEYDGSGTATVWGHGNYHHDWGGIFRRASDGRLIAFRPWMRYGSSSGSQDEMWYSDSNGTWWERLPGAEGRPWGTYPNGASNWHRAGNMPLFDERDGKWRWLSYGDDLQPYLTETADWTNFTDTALTNCAYPHAFLPDPMTPGRLWAQGDKDSAAGGWSSQDSWVVYDNGVRNMAAGFALDPAGNYNGMTAELRDNRAWSSEL